MSNLLNPHDRPARLRRTALFAAALLTAAGLALVVAPGADAGAYRAVQCHEGRGAGHEDASYRANSPRYSASADCDRAGLGITHQKGRKRTQAGRFGAWKLKAPTGARIVRASAAVRAYGDDGHAPQARIDIGDGAHRALRKVRGDRHPVRWSGAGGRALVARLWCSRRRSCGRGTDAQIHLRRVALTLRDVTAPTIEVGGSLLAGGARRGSEVLRVEARDLGAGVRTVTVELNGAPLAARELDCALRGRVAIRTRPCPASANVRFDLATTGRRFRQGPNGLRICAADYSPRSNSNRRCARRTVRVDNHCPVAEQAGAVLRARFRGAGRHLRTRSDRPAVVTGRLTDSAGVPVSGAKVCVAARTMAAGTRERVVATPMTSATGSFTAKLPPGASRAVRIAHWPNAKRALERHLRLEARAIPRLSLRPRRVLRNGERLRFVVRIPGPAYAKRRVEVQARGPAGWIRIAGGRTSESGRWHGRYRFRATTGKRRYSFRAVVPKQAGYPFARGRSTIRRATVSGRTRQLR